MKTAIVYASVHHGNTKMIISTQHFHNCLVYYNHKQKKFSY